MVERLEDRWLGTRGLRSIVKTKKERGAWLKARGKGGGCEGARFSFPFFSAP